MEEALNTQTPPVLRVAPGAYSPGVPTARSGRPSLVKSVRRTVVPNLSERSEVPGTPVEFCVMLVEPAPVGPVALPGITMTLPASRVPLRSSPGTPTAMSPYPS